MNLQNSTIRSFTILNTGNTLIYSTIALDVNFSQNIANIPNGLLSLKNLNLDIS